MDLKSSFLEGVTTFGPVLATIVVVIAVLILIDRFLKRRWKENPDAQFRFQLIMLALTFAGVLAVVVALPVSDALRGQLLSLIGILLSAAIALSSTTFIGNIMAGIMLRAVKSARPGDFITVADLTGRITEMDLLHTEVQTEFRDLVTVPNLYMVTQPLKVVRASGTIISAEVSLGYDVPHTRISEVLREAIEKAELKEGFVQVRELGDFSVVYRAAGLLENVESLISARSQLRAAMLDSLHAAGIEIVSPNFMNTRAVAEGKVFIPEAAIPRDATEVVKAEAVVFDKAVEAASVEVIRKSIESLDVELAALESDDGEAAAAKKSEIEAKKSRLIEQLKESEEERKTAEIEESLGSAGDSAKP